MITSIETKRYILEVFSQDGRWYEIATGCYPSRRQAVRQMVHGRSIHRNFNGEWRVRLDERGER